MPEGSAIVAGWIIWLAVPGVIAWVLWTVVRLLQRIAADVHAMRLSKEREVKGAPEEDRTRST